MHCGAPSNLFVFRPVNLTAELLLDVAALSVNDALRQSLLLAEARAQARRGGGDFIELGVYRGGTALLLAAALDEAGSAARLHLLDAWQGMPPPTLEDGRPWIGQGYFADASEAGVRAALARHRLLHRCQTAAGWFEQTLPAVRGPFAFAHVDCDYYAPVRYCLDHLLPRMAAHGTIVVDDHGDAEPRSFPGVARAVQAAIAGTDWQLQLLGGLRDQAVILRRAADAAHPLTLI